MKKGAILRACDGGGLEEDAGSTFWTRSWVLITGLHRHPPRNRTIVPRLRASSKAAPSTRGGLPCPGRGATWASQQPTTCITMIT